MKLWCFVCNNFDVSVIEFEEAFNLFDKDRDGSITKEELGRVMRGLGQFARTEELRTMLEEIDTDGESNVVIVILQYYQIDSNFDEKNCTSLCVLWVIWMYAMSGWVLTNLDQIDKAILEFMRYLDA